MECTCYGMSDIIAARLKKNGTRFFCNDNISEHIDDVEKAYLLQEVETNVEKLLRSLVIDIDNDHNTKETAKRVAKMFMQEIFAGRYEEQPKVTAFPNVTSYDQVYVTGPISIRSTCAHHMLPIIGKAYIGVYPSKNVIGLSKFNRLVEWIVSRPQIQEEMTQQIADIAENVTDAEGVAVLLQCEHGCMSSRGVKEHQPNMITSVVRGTFRDDSTLKQEFFNMVGRI